MFENTHDEITNDLKEIGGTDESDAAPLLLKMQDKPSKTSVLAERKKKRKLFEQHQGRDDAQMWLETVHPADIMAFIRRIGEFSYRRSRPWIDLDEAFRELRNHLESWGNEYSRAFISCVRRHWNVIRRSWENVLYTQGIADGSRWASDIAHPKQVERIRSEIKQRSLDTPWEELWFCDKMEYCTPAHRLVVWVLGDEYPRLPPAHGDDIGDIVTDCDEFKQFWQPFIAGPVDEVLDDLKKVGGKFSKLESETYIAGFVDGALAISQDLKAKHCSN